MWYLVEFLWFTCLDVFLTRNSSTWMFPILGIPTLGFSPHWEIPCSDVPLTRNSPALIFPLLGIPLLGFSPYWEFPRSDFPLSFPNWFSNSRNELPALWSSWKGCKSQTVLLEGWHQYGTGRDKIKIIGKINLPKLARRLLLKLVHM